MVVEPDADRIAAAVTPRTRLIALSHVLWTTGAVLPVHELRAHTGLPILVDGAQSVGVLDVDATGLDYYTVSGQKWLCGPEGTGALVVADPEALRVARPSYLAQQGYEPDGSFRGEGRCGTVRSEPHAEGGSRRPSFRHLVDPGVGVQRAAALAERFRAALAEAGCDVVVPAERATLVSWRAPPTRRRTSSLDWRTPT